MNRRVLQEAEAELNEAIAYYEERESGLGLRLKAEARNAIKWIGQNVNVPRLRPKGYRRVNLKAFSYYIAYFVWADTIWILAIAHSPRRPNTGSAGRAKLTDFSLEP